MAVSIARESYFRLCTNGRRHFVGAIINRPRAANSRPYDDVAHPHCPCYTCVLCRGGILPSAVCCGLAGGRMPPLQTRLSSTLVHISSAIGRHVWRPYVGLCNAGEIRFSCYAAAEARPSLMKSKMLCIIAPCTLRYIFVNALISSCLLRSSSASSLKFI